MLKPEKQKRNTKNGLLKKITNNDKKKTIFFNLVVEILILDEP